MLEESIVFTAITSIFVAALQDARVRLIPNTCVLIVAFCGICLSALDSAQSVVSSLAASTAVLIALVLMFQFRVVGGGDAKLIPASCLLLPAAQVPIFLMLTALLGGLLALLIVVGVVVRSKSATYRSCQQIAHSNDDSSEFGFQGKGIPYGVAILGGIVLTMFITP